LKPLPLFFFPNFFSTAGAGKDLRVICASYVQWQHLNPTVIHIFPSILPENDNSLTKDFEIFNSESLIL
jgi:hypothetical protein